MINMLNVISQMQTNINLISNVHRINDLRPSDPVDHNNDILKKWQLLQSASERNAADVIFFIAFFLFSGFIFVKFTFLHSDVIAEGLLILIKIWWRELRIRRFQFWTENLIFKCKFCLFCVNTFVSPQAMAAKLANFKTTSLTMHCCEEWFFVLNSPLLGKDI